MIFPFTHNLPSLLCLICSIIHLHLNQKKGKGNRNRKGGRTSKLIPPPHFFLKLKTNQNSRKTISTSNPLAFSFHSGGPVTDGETDTHPHPHTRGAEPEAVRAGFCCRRCPVAQLCPALCNPTHSSVPGFPVLHHLPEFAQVHVHWVGDATQPSHPLSPSSPPALNLSQHQGLFQWVGSSHQVVKVSELQLNEVSFSLEFYKPTHSLFALYPILTFTPTWKQTFLSLLCLSGHGTTGLVQEANTSGYVGTVRSTKTEVWTI